MMNNNKASKRFTVIVKILTGLMIAFAFVHSLMPASVSSFESEGILDFVWKFIALFTDDRDFASVLIRKLAHYSEYTVIGFLMTSCGYAYDRICPQRYLPRVLSAGLFTAVIDETIQLFTEGRAGLIQDVWIDFAGVVTGTLLALAFYAIYRKIRGIH